MPVVIEHIIDDFIKIVFVCENEKATVVGDLPALPWCFECSEELVCSSARICRSSIKRIGRYEVVIESTNIEGKLKSIGFLAYNVKCNEDPRTLYESIRNYIVEMCGGGRVTN